MRSEPQRLLLDADEATELLGLPKRRVYALVRGGDLPHLRIGRFVRFREASLARWIEEQEAAASRGTRR